MYWIDPESCSVVASEINGVLEKQIVYSAKTKESIKKYNGLITIHSHLESFPPSIVDLNSNFVNGYELGIVVTHDCKLYLYKCNKLIGEKYYSMKLDAYIAKGYNMFDAQMMVLEYFRLHFGVYFQEVTVNE